MLGAVLPSQYNRINPEGTSAANLPSNEFNTQTDIDRERRLITRIIHLRQTRFGFREIVVICHLTLFE